jgi:hypothetical protein
MNEPPTKVGSKRRPSLASALAAAKRAGQTVRSATIDSTGKVTLNFGDEASAESSGSEWDEALNRDKH